MMKKLVPVLMGFIICLCPLSVFAEEIGSIEVSLPKEMAGEEITYQREGEEAKKIEVDENGTVKIEELSEGNYEIHVPETEDYIFVPIQVHVPCWSEEEKQMLYNITIIPKYSVKEKQIPVTETPDPVLETSTPQTSDINCGIRYVNTGIISFIILVIMSCHNRFNCDTMTGKYSKNGGQKNGNDNDTENPRSTRRIRLSSPGSID